MKIHTRILSFVIAALSIGGVAGGLLSSCASDDDGGLFTYEPSLVGRAVDFSASYADEFKQVTRATYQDNGVFNENDLMRIYREYRNNNGTWDNDVYYRTYYFNTKYATGTSVSLGTDWKVRVGRKGKDAGSEELIDQQEKDSITWENGKTVRFRSWSRSNYANALDGCYRYKSSGITNYYPDYCISDWVTVSGPTSEIPLTLRHVCSRIAISYWNNGSQFYKVELATELADYKRKDNADLSANDNAATEAGKTDEQAQAELDQVMAAYNRMCMPAGVNIEKGELYAMTKTFWDNLDYNDADNKKLRYLENEAESNFYHYGTGTADDIKNNVVRPVFGNVNNSCYLITIPYDMSNGGTQGDVLVLPPCTRFRVYMRDVNNGDSTNTGGYEGTYHIFSLQDIVMKNKSGNDSIVGGKRIPMFPDGLAMLPGYSYRFYVGYRYNQLTITANDNFSWTKQDAEEDQLSDDIHVMPETSPSEYSWWKNTIKAAIPTSTGGDFNPVFHITNQKEFIEFINLVNGTAATVMDENLHRAKRNVVNPDHATNAYDKYYWWYTTVSDNKRDTTWVTSAEATEKGYLLYESYHAANANQPAYSQEEYVRGAYPFYDQTRDRHYTVYLDCDLDLYDWQLPCIGNQETTPFKGFFDGQMHTISNLYMPEEYMFKYLDGAAIRNLRIESKHKVSLAKQGINTCYIVGIDLRANSTTNSIIESLTTNQYNNPSYIVGCIHVGDAGGPLVGESGYMQMFGCMQAAEGIPSGSAALVGRHLAYTNSSNWKFLTPIYDYNYDKGGAVKVPSWGRFMCNYFDTQLSPNTWAVGDLGLSITKDYSPLEYIRGRESNILKAKNNNSLSGDVSFNALKTKEQRLAYYGLAPWRAMNYGIYRYNLTSASNTHKCKAHYENNSTGYVHRYPELKAGEPTSEQYTSTLEQNN